MKRGEIAHRGDDGVDREAGLQDGQNPAQHLKTDHTYARDDLPSIPTGFRSITRSNIPTTIADVFRSS